MKYSTHLIFALLIGLLMENSAVFVIFVLIGALLPDLDTTKSCLGKKIKPLSFLNSLLFSHRGIYHSLFMAVLIPFLLSFITNLSYSLALFTGYLSHLLLDALTKDGISLFWPLKWRLRGFITTGGLIEKAFFVIALIIIILKIFS